MSTEMTVVARARLERLAAAIALGLGVLTVPALNGPGPARAAGSARVAGSTRAAGSMRPAGRSARAARSFALNETGELRLVSKRGFVLNERGKASGTVTGTISVRLVVVSTRRVSAEIQIDRAGGSISGHGTATYRRGPTAATFSGSMSVGSGTGSYSHAHGSGLSLSGSIARSDEAITVHVRGRVTD